MSTLINTLKKAGNQPNAYMKEEDNSNSQIRLINNSKSNSIGSERNKMLNQFYNIQAKVQKDNDMKKTIMMKQHESPDQSDYFQGVSSHVYSEICYGDRRLRKTIKIVSEKLLILLSE